MDKSLQIRQSLKNTAEKRKNQQCKVRICKIQNNHLSKDKKDYLIRLFLEAKWFYNWVLSQEDIFKVDYKQKEITILNKDKQQEKRNIIYLSSQMRQAILSRIQSNIKSLSTNKKNGKNVGKLNFVSYVSSIPLKQNNNTHKIIGNYLKLQGYKNKFKINGTQQIKGEIANANLIKKSSGYYINITTFEDKEEKKYNKDFIGFDFGIKDNLIDNNGNRYNFVFKETNKLKKYSKKLNRLERLRKKHNIKNSNRKLKIKEKLKKQYEKQNNKKKDTINNFINNLKKYKIVVIQDENLSGWHKSKMKGWGKKIQHSIMGGIKSKIKSLETSIIVDKFFPSTQLCPKCGCLNKHLLDKRVYSCQCGYSFDRDTHSAINILIEGLKIFLQRKNTMNSEIKTSIKNFLNKFMIVDELSQMF